LGSTSFSNRVPQSLQEYSKIGIASSKHTTGETYCGGAHEQTSWIAGAAAFLLACGAILEADGGKIANLITGKSAFADAKDLKPSLFRKITAADLPKPSPARFWRTSGR
jgi:hypothetical protein